MTGSVHDLTSTLEGRGASERSPVHPLRLRARWRLFVLRPSPAGEGTGVGADQGPALRPTPALGPGGAPGRRCGRQGGRGCGTPHARSWPGCPRSRRVWPG